MRRTAIKICGITRAGDAEVAAGLGVDAIGLVFYPPSPRALNPGQARAVAAAAGPLTQLVGLFVDAERSAVEAVLRQVPLSLLQFHGGETPEYCASFRRPWLKALRMREGVDAGAEAVAYGGAHGILLDSYRPGVPGGTGETFDWARIPPSLAPRLVLAGGLGPGNVAAALRQVRPAAVDVSGGVESGPGIKDHTRMAAFVAAVREADAGDGDSAQANQGITQGVGGL